MKILTLEIQNDNIVDKIIWMLSHFKNDGVIIKDNTIEESIKQSVYEINQIKEGNIKARDIEELLDEL
ncbi:hypothetical protein MNB_SV-9-635 [hydrothermal vent metagenome]|uniref:Uncharacterized protein n=1 Tax=hydrothermal vent metagenome TaxID=652676 RepID=A0A1W1C5P6_9ZZZZ